jgi:hypothetical protein
MRKHYDFSKARRGPVVPIPKGKTRITIRIDDEVLDWFRAQVDAAGGGNYQSLINEALKRFITANAEPIESVVRRVVREELKRVRQPKRARQRAA